MRQHHGKCKVTKFHFSGKVAAVGHLSEESPCWNGSFTGNTWQCQIYLAPIFCLLWQIGMKIREIPVPLLSTQLNKCNEEFDVLDAVTWLSHFPNSSNLGWLNSQSSSSSTKRCDRVEGFRQTAKRFNSNSPIQQPFRAAYNAFSNEIKVDKNGMDV